MPWVLHLSHEKALSFRFLARYSPRHIYKVCLLPGDLSIQNLWLCSILPRVSGMFWLGFAKIVKGYFQGNFQMSSKCKCNWRCQHLHSSTTEDLKTLKGFGAQSQCLLIKKYFRPIWCGFHLQLSMAVLMASEFCMGFFLFLFLKKSILVLSRVTQQRSGAAVLPPQAQASWNGSNRFRSCDVLLCSTAIFQPKQDASEISPSFRERTSDTFKLVWIQLLNGKLEKD